MKLELNPNDPELNWNLALLISVIILLFILTNYGITFVSGVEQVNDGNFLTKSE